jgi:hypothetical protein
MISVDLAIVFMFILYRSNVTIRTMENWANPQSCLNYRNTCSFCEGRVNLGNGNGHARRWRVESVDASARPPTFSPQNPWSRAYLQARPLFSIRVPIPTMPSHAASLLLETRHLDVILGYPT